MQQIAFVLSLFSLFISVPQENKVNDRFLVILFFKKEMQCSSVLINVLPLGETEIQSWHILLLGVEFLMHVLDFPHFGGTFENNVTLQENEREVLLNSNISLCKTCFCKHPLRQKAGPQVFSNFIKEVSSVAKNQGQIIAGNAIKECG